MKAIILASLIGIFAIHQQPAFALDCDAGFHPSFGVCVQNDHVEPSRFSDIFKWMNLQNNDDDNDPQNANQDLVDDYGNDNVYGTRNKKDEKCIKYIRVPIGAVTTIIVPPITETTSIIVPPITETTSIIVPPTTETTSIIVPPTTETTSIIVPPITETTSIIVPPTTETTSIIVPPTTETTTIIVPPLTETVNKTETLTIIITDIIHVFVPPLTETITATVTASAEPGSTDAGTQATYSAVTTASGTAGSMGPMGPTNPTGSYPQYNNSLLYHPGDKVIYGGISFEASSAVQGVNPLQSYWAVDPLKFLSNYFPYYSNQFPIGTSPWGTIVAYVIDCNSVEPSIPVGKFASNSIPPGSFVNFLMNFDSSQCNTFHNWGYNVAVTGLNRGSVVQLAKSSDGSTTTLQLLSSNILYTTPPTEISSDSNKYFGVSAVSLNSLPVL